MENEFLKKVIMPAGAGTRDPMRIGAVVRSRRRCFLVPRARKKCDAGSLSLNPPTNGAELIVS